MPQIVSSTDSLRDDDVRSLAPAYANIPRSLAGRVRFLAEMAMGRSMLDGEPPAAWRNPRGLVGIDFSGPPFGSAFRHPLVVGGGVQTDVSGNWTGQRTVGSCVAGAPLVVPIRFWQRPFATGERVPYSRGYLRGRFFQGAAVAAFDVTVRFRSLPGSSSRDMTEVVSCTSTAEANFSVTGAWFQLIPGLNRIELIFETASTTACHVSCWEVYNQAKRSH